MLSKFCTFATFLVFAFASIHIEPAAAQNKAQGASIWGPMFRDQVSRCWNKPNPAGESAAELKAIFRIKLNQDGRLAEEPSLEDPAESGYLRSYQQSALRAIHACQPYKLPIEYYEEWKHFEPAFLELSVPPAPSAPVSILAVAARGKPDHSSSWGAIFTAQMSRCWKKADGVSDKTGGVTVVLGIKLTQDGRLADEPSPKGPAKRGYARALQESAVRAVNACQPYKLPIEYYDEWKEFEPVFSQRGEKPAAGLFDMRTPSICRGC